MLRESDTMTTRKNEEQFAMAVLITAKKIFKGKERIEMGYDKMQNLVCMVAKDMKYPLAMGWHKNGLYSPAVDAVIKRYCKPHTKKEGYEEITTIKNTRQESTNMFWFSRRGFRHAVRNRGPC